MKLHLSLKKHWFEMTKSDEKTEDYRAITPYWCNRLLLHRGEVKPRNFWKRYYLDLYKDGSLKFFYECPVIHKITSIKFKDNIMTLGYPKSTDTDRILKYKHKGIEIREGKEKWGAKNGVQYFVIKHGKPI